MIDLIIIYQGAGGWGGGACNAMSLESPLSTITIWSDTTGDITPFGGVFDFLNVVGWEMTTLNDLQWNQQGECVQLEQDDDRGKGSA